jgi:hypothetical protein
VYSLQVLLPQCCAVAFASAYFMFVVLTKSYIHTYHATPAYVHCEASEYLMRQNFRTLMRNFITSRDHFVDLDVGGRIILKCIGCKDLN